MRIAKAVTELIGNTPMLEMSRLDPAGKVAIYGKCEFMNPNGSVKDRIGLEMVEAGIRSGRIRSTTTIIEPTSGNTGIALASICAVKGIRLIITMPDSMSIERQKILRALGAEVVLTPREKGIRGSIEKAEELANTLEDAIILQQFQNPANPEAHRKTTALEIWEAMDGQVDILVAGVGTGGSLTGIGSVLQQKNPALQVIAVEPVDSAVLSGRAPGAHRIQGIGAGFIPSVLDTSLIHEIIQVRHEDAYACARDAARREGILVGISAGANLFAALKVASRAINVDKKIITILCDTGERYLSTDLYL